MKIQKIIEAIQAKTETKYELSGNGHKLLGYPVFMQGDPREWIGEEQAEYDDTLLYTWDCC